MLAKKIRELNHKRIQWGRNVLLAMAKVFFDGKKNLVIASDEDPILVFRLDGKLGDSITSTGFLRELKKQNPHSEIIILANEVAAHIYKELPFVSQVIVGKKGIKSTLKMYEKLKGKSYKYIINTSYILKPQIVFLASQLKAQEKVSWENSEFKLFTKHVILDFTQDHITDFYRKTLKSLNLQFDSINLDYEITLPKSSIQKAQEKILELRKKNQKIIILNVFAGANKHNLTAENTIKIIKLITEKYSGIVITTANRGDQQILNDWKNKNSEIKNWFIFSDLTGLNDNLALIKEADLILSPDTSIVHAACALRKPLIAIYKVVKPPDYGTLNWKPYGSPQIQIIYSDTPDRHVNAFSMNELELALQKFIKES